MSIARLTGPTVRRLKLDCPEFLSGKWFAPQTFRGVLLVRPKNPDGPGFCVTPRIRKSVTSECGVYQVCPGLRWCDPNPGPVTKLAKIFGSGNAARKIGGPGSWTRGDVWWDANPGPVTALAVFGPFQSKRLRPQQDRYPRYFSTLSYELPATWTTLCKSALPYLSTILRIDFVQLRLYELVYELHGFENHFFFDFSRVEAQAVRMEL